jgi:hypothetical protein
MASTQPGTDLRSLYDTVLVPRLAALEQERLALRQAIVGSLLLIGIPGVFALYGSDLLGFLLPESVRPFMTAIAFVLVIAGVVTAGFTYAIPGFTAYVNYRARFKREVVAEIFRVVTPGATYAPNSHIQPAVFERSGLFETRGGLSGDDLVRGRIGDTPFEACEMNRHYSTGGKNSRTITVFHGLFFRFDFNKTIHGRTYVQPQRVSNMCMASRDDLARVPLENVEFEKAFEAFSTNPVEARYILTPALMERILAIHQTTGRQVCLAFVDNLAFVAIEYGRSLFEPSIKETTAFEALEEMAEHFRLAELVVRELDLNTRIWTKEVDARLLDEAPADNKLGALDAGNLTAASLIKEVTGGLYVDEDGGPAPQPARVRARVETLANVTIVRYRLALWAVMCMLFSAGSAALAAIAVGTIVDPDWTLANIDPLGVLNPAGVAAFRSGAAITIAVCAVVGGIFALSWMTYVRRVEIEPDRIRVKRLVNPFARTYPRTDRTRILQLDRYLYLGDADEAKLINPSLSPMLRSPEEARWVASEMRRALHAGVEVAVR